MVTTALEDLKNVQKSTTVGGVIIETEGIDLEGREEPDFGEEQNLDDEARRMMKSWEKNNLMKEIEEIRERYSRDENEDYTRFYDGTQSFDELKEGMEAACDHVHYRILEDNQPDARKITVSDSVMHDRVSFFEFNPIPFESTVYDGKPAITKLAEGPIIMGLLAAMLELRQGSRAEILIHPNMGYGAKGCPPLIPPNSHIFINVKIHKVWGESELEAALEYEKAWHISFPIEEKLKLAAKQKDAANQYLSDEQPNEALIRYKAAIMWLSETSPEELQQNPACNQLLNILYQNKAITLNKLGAHKSATKAAKMALNIDSRNIKAMYQLAKARVALGDNERALRVLGRAREIAPNNADIRQLRSQIDSILSDEKKKRDEIMKKMAKACIH